MNLISESRFKELVQTFKGLKPLLVVGDIGLDKYTFGEVSRISPEAPVPVLRVTKEWEKLGLAANISHNLKTLGISSTLCGLVGEDRNANIIEGLLEDNELSTWGIIRCKDRRTTFKERITTDTQQICRVDYETKKGLDREVEEHFIDRALDLTSQHSGIIIEDYGKGLLSKSALDRLIRHCEDKNIFVAIDPSRKTNPSWYRGASLLKPNWLEAQALVEAMGYRDTKLETVGDILVEKLDLEKLVITLGAQGMALIDTKVNQPLKILPTAATDVFDVSGAGDTAISLLVAGLLGGASLEEAAWLANCGSGVVVGKKGTATVNVDELFKFHGRLLSQFS
ncbi:MAG: D-glycero-beta-D-manno-heptose-7-phosphate kinase [Halobacteriovoraceae bacterium]|nr:D-glycero-beta-D-manno-heptose-7-phosphate kinase [Halobacteriovoraceae bacterium]|tara:strand:+ start:55 stop:1071 length:1017 start_codon:yes stop_codon:yes gene_type:complete